MPDDLEEAKRILRLFRDADAIDYETGPYLDTEKLIDAYDALKAKGWAFLAEAKGGTHAA